MQLASRWARHWEWTARWSHWGSTPSPGRHQAFVLARTWFWREPWCEGAVWLEWGFCKGKSIAVSSWEDSRRKAQIAYLPNNQSKGTTDTQHDSEINFGLEAFYSLWKRFIWLAWRRRRIPSKTHVNARPAVDEDFSREDKDHNRHCDMDSHVDEDGNLEEDCWCREDEVHE